MLSVLQKNWRVPCDVSVEHGKWMRTDVLLTCPSVLRTAAQTVQHQPLRWTVRMMSSPDVKTPRGKAGTNRPRLMSSLLPPRNIWKDDSRPPMDD